MKLCFAALHPTQAKDSDPSVLAPYRRFLVALLGPRIQSMLVGSERPAPVIFKSYIDVLDAALKTVVQGAFQEMFEIAKARDEVLGIHPVEWTKRQLEILIYAEKARIRTWIKQVCDSLLPSIGAARDDLLFWGYWRAPRLIHMQPAGNTRYDQASVWTREDLVRSEELLEARAERVIEFVGLRLNELARAAHIEFVKRDMPKRRNAQETRHATQVVKPPSIDGPRTPEVWRGLHDRFRALSEEELTLAPQNVGDRWLRAYVDYRDPTKTFGEWSLSSSIHENFREHFEVEATRAGIALEPNVDCEPLEFWLHHVFSDLQHHESKLLLAASDRGGIIVRVCEASALYCVRLEKQALIDRRKGPAIGDVQTPGVRSSATDARKETLQEAVIKKVQNPQTYTVLSNPEAAAYFEVEPRTIRRWTEEGNLRRGVRRGSVTIESVLRLEKNRSRKPRKS